MPLHAITATYGEEGLRERLAAEIASFPEADRRRFARALALAAGLHAGDRRQQEPYLNHLLRVAIRILSHYGVRDADVAIAGLLHDAVEDHAAELSPDGSRAGALAVLARRFGQRVANLVEAVTNPEYEPGRDRNQQYREHVAESLDRSPWARIIKVSDFTDNGVRPDPHHRAAGGAAGRQVRAADPGAPGRRHPARHPAERRGAAAHPGTAQSRRPAVRSPPASRPAAGQRHIRRQRPLPR